MKRLFQFILIVTCLACNKDEKNEKELFRIPIVIIDTENLEAITSKDDYLEGTISINSKNHAEDFMGSIKIRGRGNTTWKAPKKPYQVKLVDKEVILGMPDDKKWIFLTNYIDKTMLRNEVAFDLGRMSNLDWTPRSRFVELVLNDEYVGIYQITQKVEESSNRVDIGSDGFLLEVDTPSKLDPDDVYFETDKHLFNIKEPDLDYEDEDFTFISGHIETVEGVLFGRRRVTINIWTLTLLLIGI